MIFIANTLTYFFFNRSGDGVYVVSPFREINYFSPTQDNNLLISSTPHKPKLTRPYIYIHIIYTWYILPLLTYCVPLFRNYLILNSRPTQPNPHPHQFISYQSLLNKARERQQAGEEPTQIHKIIFSCIPVQLIPR